MGLFSISQNPVIFFGIPLVLILGGFWTIQHDLKRWKQQQRVVKSYYVVMVAVFLFVTMYTEVIYFVIDHLGLMVNAIGTDEMKDNVNPLISKGTNG